ncbi:MAG TPA: hypothetical protein PKE49_05425 [Leptospiraceae bacterium]|nr:hypothetical protein [Leptospirales bacterium]HMU83933.1 hypothetical protein [Leptospiraceae bacterium]HMX55942.1 hypothetical protein [Leptospiraceae bacterium]HMZ36154.1 hypothetical protein [Leptospiraceae bacterium]HNE23606.1 hypothetical protein [Leptospiraceae bacterium]
MNSLFALIDRMTAKLPPNVLRLIRLGAILVWTVGATVVVFFSWKKGQDATPAQGQDLSIATIKERVQKEENRRIRGDVTVPDLGEFLPESSSPDLPRQRKENHKQGLSGVDDRLIDPENPIEKPSALPPFLGEDARGETPLRLPDTRPREDAKRDDMRRSDRSREGGPREDKPRENLRDAGRSNDRRSDMPAPARRDRQKPDLMPVE